MRYKDMIPKIQSDLGCSEHKARGYVKMFSDKYVGRKEAISDVIGSYADDGRVQISYIINGKEKTIILGGESPYAREMDSIKRRKAKQQKLQTN